ncbi:MAG: T9SS type A sorting domain-containing protein, partial [Cytophagales bacterium]|nr:T9SS type A sorting domain-containing protein [Cytophagales bacterium]
KPSINMLTFFHNNGNGTLYLSSTTSDIKNKWVNITGTVDVTNKSVSLYIDGALLSTNTFNAISLVSNMTNGLSIGWHEGDAGIRYPFNGKIDDVRFYNRALTSGEIGSIFNENKCFQTVSVTDTLKIARLTGYNSLPDNFGTLKIYPNPAKDVLNISASDPNANYTLKIVNNSGTTVYTQSLGTASQQVNLQSLGANGLYMIQILDSQNKIVDVRKLILE